MARSGFNMSLTIWDDGNDPYDHDELAANWDAVDDHNHTPGKGKRLTSASFENNSVTGTILAPNSVTSAHIVNGTIVAEDLANGIIGPEHLALSILKSLVPLGMVAPWYRPSTTYDAGDGAGKPPKGWAICDGSTWATISNDLGLSSGNIVDLRDRFIMGATATTNEASTGGANSKSFAHTHGLTVPSMTTNAHSHTVNDHAHGIVAGGNHRHWFFTDGGTKVFAQQRPYEISTGGTPRQALYVPGFNEGGTTAEAPVSEEGNHNHGGATQGVTSSVTTSNEAGLTTPATSVTTNSQSSSSLDVRPAYVGLLYIMKVKY